VYNLLKSTIVKSVTFMQVLVSLEEAAAVNNSQYLALVRVLHDFRPQSPYELRLRKVQLAAQFFTTCVA